MVLFLLYCSGPCGCCRSEFREYFKKENPNNKFVVVVGKSGANKWNSMFDDVVFCLLNLKLQQLQELRRVNQELMVQTEVNQNDEGAIWNRVSFASLNILHLAAIRI